MLRLHQDNDTDDAQNKAASTIQRTWRKRNDATSKYMTTELRWTDAIEDAKLKTSRDAAERGLDTPRARWKHAVLLARKLQDGNDNPNLPGDDHDDHDAQRKHLETQHWLELVDGKHRYGSNLKWYHQKWCQSDTSDNFFKWLDKGEGRTISLKECPREQLEKERITYLTAEQRLNYLVEIDSEGKLRWARNRELVDTSAGHWKDAGSGGGIVPEDSPAGTIHGPAANISPLSSRSSLNTPMHYAEPISGKSKVTRMMKKYLTVHGIINRLLRKTVRRNTWIYVSDKKFNLFIGIKETGGFQHSSLLAGGQVTSAGLITVKEGIIHTLSPLSGHYRTTIDPFHHFIDVLASRGVDMSKAKISKAEAALWGIEHITKVKKAASRVSQQGKTKGREQVQSAMHDGWKRDVFEGRKQQDS
ncbi:hypothetical protein ONZ45_g3000 [Pleurotus djamor]|nr:hypothetical protein ONZ45_g3000 [Pleurotus djamor]